MDSSDSSYNTVQKCFPNAKVLMCFFHVKFNCKKNYRDYGLTNLDWNIVESDIDFLHASLNQHEFDLKVEKIFKKCHDNKWDK